MRRFPESPARRVATAAILLVLTALSASTRAAVQAIRPPSVPLIASDPYFSIWSPADRLTDATTVHWTGQAQPLTSMARIDGKAYRLMGTEPATVPALRQISLQVLPTQTAYAFEGGGVRVRLSFLTPMLPSDLEVFARPLTYVTWQARATDGRPHSVSVYFDAGSEIAVNTPDQPVVWARQALGKVSALRIGTQEQPVLEKRGDNLRVDWGYMYVAPLPGQAVKTALAAGPACRDAFAGKGLLPGDDKRMPRPPSDAEPVAAVSFNLGKVGAKPVSRTAMVAYDDLYGIQFFGQNLRSYWRRNGAGPADLLQKAAAEYPSLAARCAAFDARLMGEAAQAGGAGYASLCALAYRQCMAANKLVADPNGQPLLFPKENFSNGCIATVDIIYPQGPQFLLVSPTLTKATLAPIMEYARSERWRWPFAPHDLGTYPQANGQVYGGGERTIDNQMPVEETGNMLILLAALAKSEGNANFAGRYWPTVAKWAEYLREKGLDPENQLCTDDFAGHLAHNVNLSAKAIVALGSYAMLCDMRGDKADGATYRKVAQDYARRWMEMARDGDHYRLAFDKPDTWSQKYNLVWDKILGLNLFPASVATDEMATYRKHLNKYGLPLDYRKDYAKVDWTLWTATLTGKRADFDALAGPVFAAMSATEPRVPMTDWYWTTDAAKSGFQARSVVGGVFLRMLYDTPLWLRYVKQDRMATGNWAPVPPRPTYKPVLATSENEPATWRYTFVKPEDGWMRANFSDASWSEGPAGFGTNGPPNAVVRTEWNTPDIWVRRTFNWSGTVTGPLYVLMYHDENAQVYINGVHAASARGFTTGYDAFLVSPAAKATLHPGQNVLAIHCHQTTGGQYIDAGLAVAVPATTLRSTK